MNNMQVIMDMEEDKKEEPASFLPVIPRLDRLDRLLQVLEEKQRFSRRDFCTVNAGAGDEEMNDGRKTLSSALEEVQHKGTLLDRLALLENRVFQLSLEMDEENTSKSSSSTFQVVSERTAKDTDQLSTILPRKDINVNEGKIPPPEMQNVTFIQAQDEASSSEGEFVTKRAEQQQSNDQKTKNKKKWLGLFRFRFTC